MFDLYGFRMRVGDVEDKKESLLYYSACLFVEISVL
jgi:hypothetical protein